MTRIGQQSPYLHGIPIVANSAERDLLFPSPDTRQRVQNLGTGYFERYTGTFWAPEMPIGNLGPIVKAKTLGAKGDGSSDDTAAIQAAITAAGQTGYVYLDPGIYKTSSTLTTPSAGITLYGPHSSSQNGAAVTIINTVGGPILTVNAGSDPTFTIRNIGFIGDQNVAGGAGATVDGITLVSDSSGNLDSSVINCSFLGLRKCIISAGRNLNVLENTFANCQRGVQIESAPVANRAFKIKRNLFHGMGNADTDADVYVNDAAAYNIVVRDNYRDEGVKGKFFYAVSGVSRVEVCDNHLDRMQNNAIELGDASNVTICGNFIYGEARASGVAHARGIFTGALTGARIANNFISRVSHDGIIVNGVSVATSITDNTILDAGQETTNTYDAIGLTTGGSKGVVHGNVIANTSGSTRYGVNGGAGWSLGINYVTSTGTGSYNGSFDAGNPAFGNTIFANKVGAQMRLFADGTTAKDGGLFVNASGDVFLSNWDANRGFKMPAATGNIQSLAGGMMPGNFGASQASVLWMGSGVPSNANGANGDFYFRTDTPGTGNQRLYVKSAGSWVGIV